MPFTIYIDKKNMFEVSMYIYKSIGGHNNYSLRLFSCSFFYYSYYRLIVIMIVIIIQICDLIYEPRSLD